MIGEMDMWLYYDMMGWAVIDPMNEGKKGAATGKLAAHLILQVRYWTHVLVIIFNRLSCHIEKQIGIISGYLKDRAR